MTDSTLTFRVDDDLKNAFAEVAKGQDRSAAQLLRDFMRSTVQEARDRQLHDAWFHQQVALGRHAVAEGFVETASTTEDHFRRLREAAREKQHAGAADRPRGTKAKTRG